MSTKAVTPTKTMFQQHQELAKELHKAVEAFAEHCKQFKSKTKIRRDMTNSMLVPKLEQYGKDVVLAMANSKDINQKNLLRLFQKNNWVDQFEAKYPLPDAFYRKLSSSAILPGDTYYEKDAITRYVDVLIRNSMFNAQKTYLREHSVQLTSKESEKYQELKTVCGDNIEEYLQRSLPHDSSGFLQKVVDYRAIYEGKSISFEEVFNDYHLLREQATDYLQTQFIMKEVQNIDSPKAKEAYDHGMKLLSFKLADMVLGGDNSETYQKTLQLKNMVTRVYFEMKEGKEPFAPQMSR